MKRLLPLIVLSFIVLLAGDGAARGDGDVAAHDERALCGGAAAVLLDRDALVAHG
jgi:hypothetical protein